MKVKLKGNKKGASNLFVDGVFMKAGTEIEVSDSFYEANKDQFDVVGTVESADLQRMAAENAKSRAEVETSIRAELEAKNEAEIQKRVAAELKKRDDEAAKAAKK
jgi:preprotein translocase subunit SecF